MNVKFRRVYNIRGKGNKKNIQSVMLLPDNKTSVERFHENPMSTSIF